MILLWLALHYLFQTASSAQTNSTSTTTFKSEDGTVCSTDYRSTAEIVISCLSTIVLCTWHAAHPNVREYKAAWWKHLVSKIRIFILALLAPEVLMVFAFRQYYGARAIAEAIGNEWSPVEGHFLQMGGVIFLCNGRHRFLLPEQILENEHNNPFLTAALEKLQGLHRSRITADDIFDRSKASGLTKWLTFGQTIWFIVQFVARPVQGLALTELEVITLAYCALNVVTFWLWKDKPLDVQCPIVIELGTIPSNAVPPPPSSILQARLSSRRHWDWQPESLSQILMEWLSKVQQFPDQVMIELELDSVVSDSEDFDAIGQFILTISAALRSVQRLRCSMITRVIGMFALLILCIPPFALKIILVVTLSALMLVFSGIVDLMRASYVWESLDDDSERLTREYAFAPFYYTYRTPTQTAMVFGGVVSLLATAFGAIHCISWLSTFASPTHRNIWRVCSLLITFIPVAFPVVACLAIFLLLLATVMADTMQNPPADGQTVLLTEANAAGTVAANTECDANAIAPPSRFS